MNLLHLHWGFIVGGGARYMQLLTQLSKEFGIYSHLILVAAPQWQTDEGGLNYIEHTRIPIKGRLDLSWIQPVADNIMLRKPDLIMTHGFNAHFVALMSQRCLKQRFSVICSYHGPYHPVSLKTRILGFAYDRFTEFFFRKYAISIVTVANHARSQLIKRGVPASKITVIHNGIADIKPGFPYNAARAKWRQNWDVKDNELLITSVGRLDPIKGQMYLIDAFNALAGRNASARLVLIGDGPDRMNLEAKLRSSQFADRILLAGNLPRAEEILPAVDIYVLPSLSECHSIGLLEAMRAGLPIVATSVGGNPESIVDGQEGLLVPAYDTKSMAAALERLLSDNSLCKKLGDRARERYLKDFTQDFMLKKTAEWLIECLAIQRKKFSEIKN